MGFEEDLKSWQTEVEESIYGSDETEAVEDDAEEETEG